jgi:hypothetical protein
MYKNAKISLNSLQMNQHRHTLTSIQGIIYTLALFKFVVLKDEFIYNVVWLEGLILIYF